MNEIIKSYIIQHKNVRGEWVNEQLFSNALDCYTVIKKWGVVWPSDVAKIRLDELLEEGELAGTKAQKEN